MTPMYEFRLSTMSYLNRTSSVLFLFTFAFYLIKIRVMICRLVIGYIEMVT